MMDDDFGNRDPQACSRPARRPRRFGRDFNPAFLATTEDCRAATAEINEDIASIAGALEVYRGQDRSLLPPETISRLYRTNQALTHHMRIRHLIGLRHDAIKSAEQEELQRIITERAKLKHEQKLERIRLSNSTNDVFKDAWPRAGEPYQCRSASAAR